MKFPDLIHAVKPEPHDAQAIRERMLGMLAQVDKDLAGRVSEGLGMPAPARVNGPLNLGRARRSRTRGLRAAGEVGAADVESVDRR